MTWRPIVVVGAGGFGREVLDVLLAINDLHDMFEVVGVLATPEPPPSTLKPWGVDYLGDTDLLAELDPSIGFVVGIGDPAARRRIVEANPRRSSPALIHPSATLGQRVEIGPGAIICSHVSITNNVTIGRHVHLNLNSTVGHDAQVGDYVTASPLVGISGNVTVGEGAFLGTGAVVNPRVTIGARAVIGSGAAVVRDIPPDVTAVGVPARPL